VLERVLTKEPKAAAMVASLSSVARSAGAAASHRSLRR